MNVLSIGTDRKIFENESAVYSRSKDYASKVHEYHSIVFSLKNHNLKAYKHENLFVYPTNSSYRILYILDAIKIGKDIIKKAGFSGNNTVVSCQDPFETGIVGYFLSKKFFIPLQLQIHTDFLSPYFKKNFLNIIRVFIAKFLVPRAQGIRVVSSVICDSIKNRFPNLKSRIDILPIFVDLKKKDEVVVGKESNSKNILIASRLTKEKRIDVAIKSFKKVLDKVSDVKLIIAGDGPEKVNLLELVKKLNMSDGISFFGWQNDIFSIYPNAQIFLLTSEYEGYGMTLIEAGASGLPIVTTEVGIAKTDIFKNGENSFVCPVGDVDCLSRSLIDLVTNEEKRKLFSERMKDSIRRVEITKEEYVSKYVDLLKKLLK
ncbi:MAG: glycosyltransferase [Parcubacteria group bacterium]